MTEIANDGKVIVTDAGAVRTVTLNRPEARNAVDPEAATLLRAAFAEFEADDSLHVAILTGSGGNFCAGFDLKRVGDGLSGYDPGAEGPMGPTRMQLSKPVIAAVEGFAVAGGLELALWCDLRVASVNAQFGVFCRRWGVPLIDGGTVRLPRLIGHGRAMDMILTGRAVDAHEAREFGLANRVVAEGNALMAAEKLAAEIAQFPSICMRSDRQSACAQWGLSLDDAILVEARMGINALTTDAPKGAARFAHGEGRGGKFE
jgi:enoyl-CoA hydratase